LGVKYQYHHEEVKRETETKQEFEERIDDLEAEELRLKRENEDLTASVTRLEEDNATLRASIEKWPIDAEKDLVDLQRKHDALLTERLEESRERCVFARSEAGITQRLPDELDLAALGVLTRDAQAIARSRPGPPRERRGPKARYGGATSTGLMEAIAVERERLGFKDPIEVAKTV